MRETYDACKQCGRVTEHVAGSCQSCARRVASVVSDQDYQRLAGRTCSRCFGYNDQKTGIFCRKCEAAAAGGSGAIAGDLDIAKGLKLEFPWIRCTAGFARMLDVDEICSRCKKAQAQDSSEFCNKCGLEVIAAERRRDELRKAAAEREERRRDDTVRVYDINGNVVGWAPSTASRSMATYVEASDIPVPAVDTERQIDFED